MVTHAGLSCIRDVLRGGMAARPVPKFMRRRVRLPVVAPWGLSERPGPDAVPNEPTEMGRELGRNLARLTDVAEAEMRKTFPNHAPRCDDCAFKAGTDPNGCEPTLMDAIKCAVENIPFFCHKGVADGGPVKAPCRGWMLWVGSKAQQALQEFAVEVGKQT